MTSVISVMPMMFHLLQFLWTDLVLIGGNQKGELQIQ